MNVLQIRGCPTRVKVILDGYGTVDAPAISLTPNEERDGRSRRRIFRAGPKGQQALRVAKRKIRELFIEVVGDD
jgi:hypothetical protein